MRHQRASYYTSLLAAMIVWLLLAICETESGKIDSHDLLVGNWNMTIRCSKAWFESELFPPCASRDAVPPVRKLWWGQRDFQCNLSLFPNGTFGLQPQDDESTTQNCLPLHGRWALDPNPYCVTDRFYDQVVLQSYPRMQKKVVNGQEAILQTLSLDLWCRLTGHFSHGRQLRAFLGRGGKPPYASGKLSHGVFILSREQSAADQPVGIARRRIAASFKARRHIPSKLDLAESAFDDEGGTLFGY